MEGGSSSWWENKINSTTISGDDAVVNGVSGVLPIMVTPTPMKLGKAGKRFPVKLKDLLATGILEGLNVRYVKGHKAHKRGEKELQGVIKDSGILCFCGSCKGNQVVSPTVFELHAGSAKKHPPEYTYLENGKLLRDVMNACSSLPLDTLDEVVQMVLGDFTMQKSNICFNCRGSISESDKGESKLVCNPCMELKETQTSQLQTAGTCSESITPVVQPRDLRLHKLVFEEDVLPDGTEVAYYSHGEKLLEGYKKGYGIFCACCSAVVSASKFEAHAGWSSRRKPYQHIYTSNGVSLHELSLSLSKDRRFSFFFWYDRRFSAIDNNELYTTNLSQGEDVVHALYRLSEAFHHRRLVSIGSATGYVSDVLFHDQDGSHAHTGVFEITSLSLQCLADEDGWQCRNKATCSVLLTDDKGNTFEMTGVNSLIADGPIEIIAEVEKDKSAGESSSSAVVAAAGDGNINPTTTTTGAANDQDKKSPSEEDI